MDWKSHGFFPPYFITGPFFTLFSLLFPLPRSFQIGPFCLSSSSSCIPSLKSTHRGQFLRIPHPIHSQQYHRRHHNDSRREHWRCSSQLNIKYNPRYHDLQSWSYEGTHIWNNSTQPSAETTPIVPRAILINTYKSVINRIPGVIFEEYMNFSAKTNLLKVIQSEIHRFLILPTTYLSRRNCQRLPPVANKVLSLSLRGFLERGRTSE